ncbi:ribonuclease P/MRP protein subunit POP5 [Copidosoma floridanum]|uniref:ribonuclease P/MRP protein subunit POP5 n=1 Tax=Copidosoma floridanum TaxID=29053 RepID=UPI0006C99D47|nr:ribonuclease P/MRP protein subunit POP5 [Copidosoma floridanum]
MVRYKNRYLTVQVSLKNKGDQSLNLKTNALHEAIHRKVWEMYGDFGTAAIKAGFSAKYCNAHTRIALIKVRHGPHNFLLKAVPKIIDVGGKHVSVKIIYVGATMKHCFMFIKKYQTRKLESMWRKMESAKERKDLEEALMTMTPAMKDFM